MPDEEFPSDKASASAWMHTSDDHSKHARLGLNTGYYGLCAEKSLIAVETAGKALLKALGVERKPRRQRHECPVHNHAISLIYKELAQKLPDEWQTEIPDGIADAFTGFPHGHEYVQSRYPDTLGSPEQRTTPKDAERKHELMIQICEWARQMLSDRRFL